MSAYAESYGFSFTWRIDNFSFCHLKSIASPYFAGEKLCLTPWQLILYPRCEEPSSNDCIKCELRKYGSKKKIKIDFKIEIIGPSGHILGEAYEERNAIFDEYSFVKGRSLVKRDCVERDIVETNTDTLTVRCHMSRRKYSDESSLDCIAQTKIIVNHQSLRLRWTREDELQTLFEDDGDGKITSGFIYFPDMNDYEIVFFKNKYDVEIRILMSGSAIPQCVECKISMLDALGCQVLSIRDRCTFSDKNVLWILPTFLPAISKLRFKERRHIKYESMTILCELFCSGGIESQAVSYVKRKRKLVANTVMTDHTLQSDIRNLFSDRMFCDVKFRVNGEIVEAHKLILASRSSIFYAMFQQDMLETQTGIVDIQVFDITTLKALLNFMYSDAVDNMDYDSAKNLLIVSDKYQVHRLKEMCASFLMSDTSEGNACEIAALADMVNHADLKSFALDLIVDHSKDIFITPNWLLWIRNNMELATVDKKLHGIGDRNISETYRKTHMNLNLFQYDLHL